MLSCQCVPEFSVYDLVINLRPSYVPTGMEASLVDQHRYRCFRLRLEFWFTIFLPFRCPKGVLTASNAMERPRHRTARLWRHQRSGQQVAATGGGGSALRNIEGTKPLAAPGRSCFSYLPLASSDERGANSFKSNHSDLRIASNQITSTRKRRQIKSRLDFSPAQTKAVPDPSQKMTDGILVHWLERMTRNPKSTGSNNGVDVSKGMQSRRVPLPVGVGSVREPRGVEGERIKSEAASQAHPRREMAMRNKGYHHEMLSPVQVGVSIRPEGADSLNSEWAQKCRLRVTSSCCLAWEVVLEWLRLRTLKLSSEDDISVCNSVITQDNACGGVPQRSQLPGHVADAVESPDVRP